jgi:hypothetical protein
MRGYPEFNFPAFYQAADFLRARGYHAFNPAERDAKEGFDPTGLRGDPEELAAVKFDLRAALECDTSWICREATHIYMLPGWSNSKGAMAERWLGLALGLTIEGAAS